VKEPPALGIYNHIHTQFDGVTFEDTVTHLSLASNYSAELPLTSCSQVGSPVDFTFKFWFKVEDFYNNSPVQFFSFPDSVSCYFIGAQTIMCDTPQRQRLIVQSN